MKKLLLAIVLLLALAMVGCQHEEAKTPYGWALWAVQSQYDGTDELITPYIISYQEAMCVFDEDINDGEDVHYYYACFIVKVQQDLNRNATERTFAVFIGWEVTFWQRWPITSGDSRSQMIAYSKVRDIDVAEMGK